MINFLEKHGRVLPVVVFQGEKLAEHYKNVTSIKSNTDIRSLVRFVAKQFNVTAKEMTQLQVSDYFPFPIKLLVPGVKYSIKIYLDRSPGKYDVFKNPDQEITKRNARGKEIRNYRLYVEALDRLRFVNESSEMLVKALDRDDLDVSERMGMTQVAFDIVSDLASKVGIDQHTYELAQLVLLQ